MGLNLRNAKMGQTTTPGGADGDNAPQTVDNTVRSLGPLEAGWYTLEASVACHVLQGNLIMTTDNVPTAGELADEGLSVPATTEVEFSVDGIGDEYLIWTRSTMSGTLKVNTRTRPGRAV